MSDKKAKIYLSAVIIAAVISILFLSVKSSTLAAEDESIKIKLSYLDKSNGVAPTGNVIGIGIEKLKEGLDEDKLCTKWDVYSLDIFESTQLCHGSKECCNFIRLEPSRESWKEPFYLSYGKHGATDENIVTGLAIYFDVSIEDDKASSEVYYSEAESLKAKFINKKGREIKAKDKAGKEIGSHEVVDKEDGTSDVEIADDRNRIKLHGVKNLEKLNAIIDRSDDKKLQTNVIAIENNPEIESAAITLEKTGPVNAVVYCKDSDLDKKTLSCLNWQKTNIPFIDNGDTITFTVTHFSAYAGANITIIDVKSLPEVGKNWTVRFNTTGNADLIITAINGTTFGTSAPDDLEFLELKCGNNALNPILNGSSVIYQNYSCSDLSYHTVKAHTSGSHYQEFRFGDDVGYAENYAFGKCNGSEPPNPADDNLNWNITNATVCSNEFISINGNITILSGGSLTLRHVNLSINCSPSTGIACGINVTSGSSGLFIYNSSIASNNSNYTFQVFAPLEIKNSLIKDVGYNRDGFVDDGIYLGFPATIEDSVINRSFMGIILASNSSNITRTNFTNISARGITDDSTLTITTVNTKVEDSTFSDIGGLGGAAGAAISLGVINRGNNITLIRVKIINTSRGIFDNFAQWLIINSTFENPLTSDFRILNGNITILNTTINRTKITFGADPTGNITLKWYVTVNITDKSRIPLAAVNVSAYRNDTATIEWTKLTGADGSINATETTEGTVTPGYNSSFSIYLNSTRSPFNFTANKTGYKLHFMRLDINQSIVIEMILDQFPSVTALSSPIDNANISNSSVSFNFTATDDLNASNCTLHINQTGQWNAAKTELTIINGTVNTINLTNLTNGTYVWSIECIDNSSSSDFFSQNYTLTIDTIPSNITNVTNSSITHNSVIITWNTGELTNSSVKFGGQDQLTSATTDTAFVTSHSITLALSPETQYFYNVTSCDPSGNCVMNGTFNFTTASAPSSPPEDKDKGSGGSPGAGPGDGKEKGETPEAPKPSPPAEESFAEATTRAWSLSGISDIKEFCDTANRSIEYLNRFCQRYHESKGFIEINRSFEYDPIKNETLVNLTIIPEAELVNFSYYESIPKCIALLIKEGLLDEIPIEFKNMNFEVVEEDPLIVWHFTEIKEPIDLSYVVDKELLENCTDLLAGFGIAELIKPFEEKGLLELSPEKEERGIFGFLKSPLGGGIITILLIAILVAVIGFGYRIEVSREKVFNGPGNDLLSTVQRYFKKIYSFETRETHTEMHLKVRKKMVNERPKHASLAEIVSDAIKIAAVKIKLPHIRINAHAEIESLKKDAVKGLAELQAKKDYLKNRLRAVEQKKKKAFAKYARSIEDSEAGKANQDSAAPESKELPSLPPPPEHIDMVKKRVKIAIKQKERLDDLISKEFAGSPLENYSEASKQLVWWMKQSIVDGRNYEQISSIAENSGWDSEDIKKAYKIAVAI